MEGGAGMRKEAILGLLAAVMMAAEAQTARRVAERPREVLFSQLTGEQLVDLCKHAERETLDSESLECQMYLAGFRDGYNIAMYIFNDQKQSRFCPPDAVTVSQMAKVVVKYGNDHPQDLWLRAGLFTITALKEAYPCQAP
jgi:hypothetical protein